MALGGGIVILIAPTLNGPDSHGIFHLVNHDGSSRPFVDPEGAIQARIKKWLDVVRRGFRNSSIDSTPLYVNGLIKVRAPYRSFPRPDISDLAS